MKRKNIVKGLVILLFCQLSFLDLWSQTWTFNANLEGWGWGLEQCTLAWSSGNMVVSTGTSTERSNFGYSEFELSATSKMNLSINVKNESDAAFIYAWLWVKKTPGSDTEDILLVTFPVVPNSSRFVTYSQNLTTLPGYSANWRFSRIRLDADKPGSSRSLTFNYVSFVSGGISFSIPGNYSSYRTGSNVSYEVAADSSIAPVVSKVEFYRNGTKVAEDLTAPYQCTLSNVQAGYYQIQAVAFDASAQSLDTAAVSELFVGTTKTGVRPLARGATYDFDRDVFPNNPGGYFADYAGQYPFVASYTDYITPYDFGVNFIGDFHSRKAYFEDYLPFNSQWIDTNPQTNPLIERIRQIEQYGIDVEYIIVAREGELYNQPTYTYGPFAEDSRILYQRDVNEYRQLFIDAFEAGIIKKNNYALIQLVTSPTAFYTIPEARAIVQTMDGVCFESHQYGVHWPLEKGVEKDLNATTAAMRWVLANDLNYIFYYGPWRSTVDPVYYQDCPKDWLYRYWAAGMPKYHDKMHVFTNNFPFDVGKYTPVGPETNPNSHTGFVKWLIEEVGRQTPLPVVERKPVLEWTFDKSIERMVWGKTNCNLSWANNSLVMEAIASGTISTGCSEFSYHLENVDTLSVRLKNESPATFFNVKLWIAEPHHQAEYVKTFSVPVSPNSSVFQTCKVGLSTAIANYSLNWRVRRISIEIPDQTIGSRVSFDFIRFHSFNDTGLYNNVLLNTGFENPSVLTFEYRPSSAEWTFSGGSGVQRNESEWGAAKAPEGIQTLFLKDSAATVSQTIKVLTAGKYVVRFKAARRNTEAQTVNVYFDSTKVGTFTPASSIFTEYETGTFFVTAGIHTIKFQSIVSGDITAFIDEVYFLAPPSTSLGWEFNSDVEGWSRNPHNVTTSWNNATTLECDVTGEDPYVYNTTSPNFQTTNFNYLEIKVKNSTSGRGGQIYIWTTTTGFFVIPFPLTPNNPVYEKVLIDLRTISGWNNNLTVTDVRIDPNGGGEKGNVSFDYIIFKKDIVSNISFHVTDEIESKIYPNPATDNVRIELPVASSIDIYGVNGQLVYSSGLKSNEFDINTGNWVSGLYIVRIKSGNKVQSKKLILR